MSTVEQHDIYLLAEIWPFRFMESVYGHQSHSPQNFYFLVQLLAMYTYP